MENAMDTSPASMEGTNPTMGSGVHLALGAEQKKKIERLAGEFEASRKLLMALGDESRLHIILTMMRMGDCNGVRAIEVAEQTSLSRPAVSHHLQILKDAGILKTRKEGTKIFYYFDPDMRAMGTLIDALRLSIEITQALPDRSANSRM